MQSNTTTKKEIQSEIQSESRGIHDSILSTLISPYRLWANPLTSSYATLANDKDWDTLKTASYPFYPPVNVGNSSYDRICSRPLFTYHSKNKAPFTSIRWFPDFRRSMATTSSGELCVFSSDFCTLEDIKRLPSSAGPLTSLEWLNNESMVLTGDWGGSVHLSSPTLSPMGILKDLIGHSIIDISSSPSSIKIAATASDAHPTIWDINQQAKERSLSALGFDINYLQWHPYQGLLATGSKSDQLAFWDPRSSTPVKTIMAHKGSITSLRFSPDGQFLATSGRDSLIRIWELKTLKCWKQFRYSIDSDCRITVLRWHPIFHTRFIISGDSSGTITHFDLSLIENSLNSFTKQQSSVLRSSPILTICQNAHRETHSVSSIDFHSSGSALASCGTDATIRIWVPPL